MKAGYEITTGAPVALSPATAKTVLCVLSPGQFGIDLRQLRLAFDGVTAAAVPVLVEICSSTAASNSTPGTNNTLATINQIYGRTVTTGFTGFYNSTTEPTVLTAFDRWTISPNGGLLMYDWPSDRTPDIGVSAGFAIRCTAPAPVNVNASLAFERC